MGEESELGTPAGRRHIIERPRLTRLLDETSARAIMLVAPAGYGKTTLARQWLAGRSHIWFQANAESSDIAALALGLSGGAAEYRKKNRRRLREWLLTTKEPEQHVSVAAELLADDLDATPETVLAIDDYQRLASPASEHLVEALVERTGLRVLITSRVRPSWITPRQLLYGDAYEIGRSVLAMSYEEAGRVLSAPNSQAAGALVALADGWPAVIGLASFTNLSTVLAEDALPAELYDYIAEELYGTLDVPVQVGLCKLSLLPELSRPVVRRMLEEEAELVADRGTRAGFVVSDGSDGHEMHPLLRAFLQDKFARLQPGIRDGAVVKAFEAMLRSKTWEEAFSLINRLDRPDLLEQLVTAAFDDLTQHGRVETLRSWSDRGRHKGVASPSLLLMEAECAFRKGFHERAKALARRASTQFDKESPLASKALYRAGLNAHLTDAPQEAVDDFRQAQALARTPHDARNAIWGRFVATVESEEPGALELLEAFTNSGDLSTDDLVRIQNGKLYVVTRSGGLHDTIAEARSVTSLVHEACDPIARVSFWHIYGAALRLAARYDEARAAIDAGLREIEASHLEFARPHILLTRASVAIGRSSFLEAAALLDEVQAFGEEHSSDDYLSMNAIAIRCRLLLLQGAPESAVAVSRGSWPRVSSRGQKAEYLASRALAYGFCGHPQRARELLREATMLSGELEARTLCQWARALLDLHDNNREREETVDHAFQETLASGMLDTFVFACRLDSRVLSVIGQEEVRREMLGDLLQRVGDISLARKAGVQVERERGWASFGSLTPREHEVYELLRSGQSNKEIAQALFVSEVTVKVHVHRILKKLGVRTRTQAAVIEPRTPGR